MTAGQPDYARLRPLCYPDTHAVLVCFALNNRKSFDNVIIQWLPEVAYHAPNTIRILVGLKCDLPRVISKQEAEQVAKKYGFATYVEASSLKNINVDYVMEAMMRTTHAYYGLKPLQSKTCTVQ